MDLLFFTSQFPFGTSESFIENEIGYLAKAFKKVYIFPASSQDAQRTLPENCEIVEGLFSDEGYSRKRTVKKYPKQIAEIFLSELKQNRKKHQSTGDLFSTCLRVAYKAMRVENWMNQQKITDGVFYTYWMSDWTTILSILNSSRKIGQLITRVHGFDLFEERQPNGFIPFRTWQLKLSDRVFAVSKQGKDYLKQKHPKFGKKISLAYLGTVDHGLNNAGLGEQLNLVSASNIIPLKRLHLIVEILKNVTINVKWTHFGDGILMDEIVEQAKTLPENIIVDFKGRVPNKTVLEHLKTQMVSFFINVSDTEGLPVSIMEAISFGIPAIVTNIGGTSEIVNKNTGILIDKEFNPEVVSGYLNDFFSSKYATTEYREEVREFWARNFNAEANYPDFVRQILSS